MTKYFYSIAIALWGQFLWSAEFNDHVPDSGFLCGIVQKIKGYRGLEFNSKSESAAQFSLATFLHSKEASRILAYCHNASQSSKDDFLRTVLEAGESSWVPARAYAAALIKGGADPNKINRNRDIIIQALNKKDDEFALWYLYQGANHDSHFSLLAQLCHFPIVCYDPVNSAFFLEKFFLLQRAGLVNKDTCRIDDDVLDDDGKPYKNVVGLLDHAILRKNIHNNSTIAALTFVREYLKERVLTNAQ